MKYFKLIGFCQLFLFISLTTSIAQTNLWKDFEIDSVVSSLDGYINKFHYYKTTSTEKKPLVVSIHQWSADYMYFKNSLAKQTKEKNWNYIFPDLRGGNNHPKACGSEYIIKDIDQVITWSIQNLPVDTDHIYIVGASGGGYNALCHFMKSQYSIREYSIWVPITDLNSWYYESISRKNKYAQDIENCICSECPNYNKQMAVVRSPIHWTLPSEKLQDTRLHIYAGIHDGYTGAVPITHSLRFYNKIVTELDINKCVSVTPNEIEWMLTTRTTPFFSRYKIGDRDVLYTRNIGNLSLTIFEGGHEILIDEVISELTLNRTELWLWNMNILQQVKKNIYTSAYNEAYQELLRDADAKLRQKSYVQSSLHEMSNAITILSQAYFFNEEEQYAKKAVDIIKAWFFDEKTSMKPNLDNSQFVWGLNNSERISSCIIDTYCFVEMLNSVKLMEGSLSYTTEYQIGLKDWFGRFADWMQTSEQSKEESDTKGCHNVAYDVQLTLYLLFSGKKKEAYQIIQDFPEKRLFIQFGSDGKQLRKLGGELTFGASVTNIRYMVEFFLIAQKEGFAIWGKESDDKKSFYKAIDILLPYLRKDDSRFTDIGKSNRYIKQQEFCEDLFRITIFDPSRKDFIKLYQTYNQRGLSDRFRLLYGASEAIK